MTVTTSKHHAAAKGRTAVAQARLILLIMINVAQLWILAATIEAALAHRFRALLPLIVASGACFIITLTIIFWWRPASRTYTSTGYLRSEPERDTVRSKKSKTDY
jgi:hypothetical protein